MYPTLRGDLELLPNEAEGCAILRPNRDQSWRAPQFFLPPLQGLALSLFDGSRGREEAVEILQASLGCSPIQAGGVIDSILTRFRTFLFDPPGCAARTPGAKARVASPESFLFATSRDFSAIREPAPRSLSWVVTEWCNRKCCYCYKDALFMESGEPPDVRFPLERVEEIAEEARRIGVENVILTGGEPFLRTDIVDVIAAFARRGLDVIPITKSRIERPRMRALAAAGLRALHVSLDSPDRDCQNQLCGVESAFDDIHATLVHAREEGVEVVLRPVMTRWNVRGLPRLIELGAELGVRRFLIDIYGETCGRHDEALTLLDEDLEWLKAEHPRWVEQHPGLRLELKFEERHLDGKPPGCMEGIRGLTILSDGRATKCEHWRFGDELIVGDLKTQSILEVWDGEAFERLNRATRASYQGSACHRCKHLENCNHVRGRCSLTALVAHGTVFAPDLYCPIGVYKRSPRSNRSALKVVA